jgi:hypothetical protein
VFVANGVTFAEWDVVTIGHKEAKALEKQGVSLAGQAKIVKILERERDCKL